VANDRAGSEKKERERKRERERERVAKNKWSLTTRWRQWKQKLLLPCAPNVETIHGTLWGKTHVNYPVNKKKRERKS
jgi:hypothetical protein